MKTKYNTYNLKENDTLISISKELNKTPIEVAGFHNIFADENNYIGTTFPNHLKELYVPLSINIKELEHTPKVNFDYDSHLSLKPSKQSLLYQVEKEISSKSNTYALRFKIEIKCVKKIGVNLLFEINKLDRKKDSSLDTILYNLIEKLDMVFYPLQLLISDEGKLIEIKNHKQILENWKNLKPTIFEEFEGKVIENYIEYFEKNISDLKTLENLLFKDLFLNTYFNNLYINYTSRDYIEKQYDFPLFSKIKNVSYLVNQKIDTYLTTEGKIEIEISGKSNDKRTQLDFESNLDESFFTESSANKIIEGNFEVKYILNSVTNTIENAKLVCDLKLNDYKKIIVSLNLIRD